MAALAVPSAVLAQTDAAGLDPGLAQQTETIAAGQDDYQRLTVPVMVDGKGPFHFFVDTGSSRSAISDSLAATLGLSAGPKVRVQAAGNSQVVDTARIPRLTVGTRHFHNLTVPVFLQRNLGADGLVGLDALANQKVTMDFTVPSIAIGPSDRHDDDPKDVVVRALSRYGQLVLLDSEVDGVDLYVIVDSGGQDSVGNLCLKRTLAGRQTATTRTEQVISVTGHEATAEIGAMPQVRMGGILVSNLVVAYADLQAFRRFGLHDKPAMMLGMDALRAFKRVSVDFKARQVRLLMMPTV